jgi:hypothetical protein
VGSVTAASKSAEKRVFRVGQIVGAVEITELFEGSIAYRDPIGKGRCTNPDCDHVRELTYQAMLAHLSGRSTGCVECRQRKQRKVNAPRHNCRACDDCPALRPADGTPCACGESSDGTRHVQ